MPIVDITNDFRQVVLEKASEIPESKRRKSAKPSARSSERDGPDPFGKEYVQESYTILNHITTLTQMLAKVRKPYLSVDSHSSPLARQTTRPVDLSEGEQSWANIRHLTNEEREQIDLQAKVILTRCAERVKEMEALEKRRVELVASKTNPLSRLLPARLRQDDSSISSDVVAAHHSSMIWYLSRRLAEASQTQKEMQEERVKRQLERTRTLGSSATREAQILASTKIPPHDDRKESSSSWLGAASSSLLAAAIGAGSSSHGPSSPHIYSSHLLDSSYVSEEDDDEIELSASQILEFEAENASILQSVQETLESVQQAEARLMDISALQMELVNQLTRQTEISDQLFEDAIATTLTVEKGNKELKEAKRQTKDSRLFIIVFLLGASFSLLFLHYY